MFGLDLKKLSHWINHCQFKVGELFFPALEPVFRMLENRSPEVRRHFLHALKGLEGGNTSVALLNLNAVLSLHPAHFMARVYRGRIYIRERRYRLAAEDYVEANKISRYRFIHYDLYREYFVSLNKGLGSLGASIVDNFGQAFEMLRQFRDSRPVPPAKAKRPLVSKKRADAKAKAKREADISAANSPKIGGFNKDMIFTKEERAKFEELEPITRRDIEETDWDELIKELTSGTEDI
jgi:hypothetical protein